jgi:hypothetical protein
MMFPPFQNLSRRNVMETAAAMFIFVWSQVAWDQAKVALDGDSGHSKPNDLLEAKCAVRRKEPTLACAGRDKP